MPSKTSVSRIFEIPKFYYFESKNDYSGSVGDFAYKIKYGEKLTALAWHGRLCSEKANIEHEKEFELSQEGFDEMVKWLEKIYNADKK